MGIWDRLLGGHHGGGRRAQHLGDLGWGAPIVGEVIPCPRCEARNPISHRFCTQCGLSLAPDNCAQCGGVLQVNAKYCGQCGTTKKWTERNAGS